MLGTTIDIPQGVSLLADHLDAALAAGEDLLAARLSSVADRDVGGDGSDEDLLPFIMELRRHEASVIARLLQARRRAMEIDRLEGHVQSVVKLFVANTSGLVDLVATFGDTTVRRFDGADDPHAFLRRRGVLGQEQGALPRFEALTVSETFRVGGVLELGHLLDLCATFLDVLDRHYSLYPDRPDDEDIGAFADTTQNDRNTTRDVGPADRKPPAGAAVPKPGSLDEALAALRKGTEH